MWITINVLFFFFLCITSSKERFKTVEVVLEMVIQFVLTCATFIFYVCKILDSFDNFTNKENISLSLSQVIGKIIKKQKYKKKAVQEGCTTTTNMQKELHQHILGQPNLLPC